MWMADAHVISALRSKRAELSGELIAAEKRIVQLRADIQNLDGAIRVANGIEQKRSLAEFFDWYNLRRPHQALGWRTPNRLTSANLWLRRHWPPDAMASSAMNLWTVGCADPRLTAQARSPMDKPGKTPCVSPTLPTGRRLPTSFTAPRNKTG